MKTILLISIVLCLCSCTARRAAQTRAVTQLAATDKKLDEEVKALVTATVDALSQPGAGAATNPPIGLALEMSQHAQQIVGTPLLRIDVAGILASNEVAMAALKSRYALENALLMQKAKDADALAIANTKLQEMGKLYEAEKNQSIVKRFWHWSVATLGIGGIVALCVFFPFLIPIFGQLIGWIVGKFPALATAFGVVGKKAFDAVVKGVGDVRDKFKNQGNTMALADVDNSLAIATDDDHKRLIDSRRTVLNV